MPANLVCAPHERIGPGFRDVANEGLPGFPVWRNSQSSARDLSQYMISVSVHPTHRSVSLIFLGNKPRRSSRHRVTLDNPVNCLTSRSRCIFICSPFRAQLRVRTDEYTHVGGTFYLTSLFLGCDLIFLETTGVSEEGTLRASLQMSLGFYAIS
jgi:hypothetical protein